MSMGQNSSKTGETKTQAGKTNPASRDETSIQLLSDANDIKSGNIDDYKYMDITLDDPYEDDDYHIYFDRAQLMGHIDHLEGDSLIKINYVSEDEQYLERIKRKGEAEFAKV